MAVHGQIGQHVRQSKAHPSGNKSFGQLLTELKKLDITECRTYGATVHEDSDSSDGSDFENDGQERNVVVVKCKWAQAVKVKFYKDRSHSTAIAVLKVKAKGKGKAVTTTTTSTDSEGNETSSTSVTTAVGR